MKTAIKHTKTDPTPFNILTLKIGEMVTYNEGLASRKPFDGVVLDRDDFCVMIQFSDRSKPTVAFVDDGGQDISARKQYLRQTRRKSSLARNGGSNSDTDHSTLA